MERPPLGDRAKPSRPLVIAFALVFLFETWIWGGMVAAVRAISALAPWERWKGAARSLINRLPAFVAVFLFGVPVVVSEAGCAVSVFFIAIGHIVAGTVGYILFKFVGLALIAVIFDVTREKLMTLRWFVFLYNKINEFHEFASKLMKPYRDAMAAIIGEWRERARNYWRRFAYGVRDSA